MAINLARRPSFDAFGDAKRAFWSFNHRNYVQGEHARVPFLPWWCICIATFDEQGPKSSKYSYAVMGNGISMLELTSSGKSGE